MKLDQVIDANAIWARTRSCRGEDMEELGSPLAGWKELKEGWYCIASLEFAIELVSYVFIHGMSVYATSSCFGTSQ
jgi:hypothetical protein